jgi:hypothetical protein
MFAGIGRIACVAGRATPVLGADGTEQGFATFFRGGEARSGQARFALISVQKVGRGFGACNAAGGRQGSDDEHWNDVCGFHAFSFC